MARSSGGSGHGYGGGGSSYSSARSNYSGGRSLGRSYSGSGRSSTSGRGASTGRTSGRSYSANTRSFVAGKIAGQYQAKGYSKAHAQNIGNIVVNKMGGTFRSGNGSTRSWTAGVVTGRNQGLYGYGLSRSTHIGNAVVRKQAAAKARTGGAAVISSSKFVNNVTRTRSQLPAVSAPRLLRRISKGRFQMHTQASILPPASAPIQPRSKVLGFVGTVPSATVAAAAPGMTTVAASSKIAAWGEAETTPVTESKILGYGSSGDLA